MDLYLYFIIPEMTYSKAVTYYDLMLISCKICEYCTILCFETMYSWSRL